MADLKFEPIAHDHAQFIARAKLRPGFSEAYAGLELEYTLDSQILGARAKAGLTQDAVAERMGTTKSAISRLGSAGRRAPSLATLKKYAEAVGCDLQVKLVPRDAA
ncbi:MAG: helix-turn-helix transcriptional regulator [Betaproteobacteria bacterium]